MGERMSLWPLWICRAPKQHYQNETGRLIIHTADSWIQKKGRTQELIWPIHWGYSASCHLFWRGYGGRRRQDTSQIHLALILSNIFMSPSQCLCHYPFCWQSLLIVPSDSNSQLNRQVRDHLFVAGVSLFALSEEGFRLWFSSDQSSGNR